jgi:hypothetical protein
LTNLPISLHGDALSYIAAMIWKYQNESSPSPSKISRNGREFILNRIKITCYKYSCKLFSTVQLKSPFCYAKTFSQLYYQHQTVYQCRKVKAQPRYQGFRVRTSGKDECFNV